MSSWKITRYFLRVVYFLSIVGYFLDLVLDRGFDRDIYGVIGHFFGDSRDASLTC